MDACPRYLCTCVYVIVCMSARKKAPVNLLMCPFELYMFIGVSMQLRVVFKYDFLVLIPYCWSVALEKKKKKKIKRRRIVYAFLLPPQFFCKTSRERGLGTRLTLKSIFSSSFISSFSFTNFQLFPTLRKNSLLKQNPVSTVNFTMRGEYTEVLSECK